MNNEGCVKSCFEKWLEYSSSYHIQDNGYINLDDSRYTDDGAVVVKGGVRKDGKVYERSYYENYIMGK